MFAVACARLHAYGQTYAIDLVHEPVEGSRPEFGQGPSFRPPEDFPANGRPFTVATPRLADPGVTG